MKTLICPDFGILWKYLSTLFVSLFSLLYVSGQEKTSFTHLEPSFGGGTQIVNDNFGYIWLSNADGLYKYDGYGFDFVPISTIFGHDLVNTREIVFSKDTFGNFWLATFNGELTQLKTNGSKIHFKNNLLLNQNKRWITAIKAQKDRVWLGNSKGTLFAYNHETQILDSIVTLPSAHNRQGEIRSIDFTAPSKLWVSTDNGQVFGYSINSKKLTKLSDPLIGDLNGIVELVSDKNGRLWVVTESQGIFTYHPDEGKFSRYDKLPGYLNGGKHPMFISVFCDSSGHIWTGTDGDGLYRIDPNNNRTTIFKHDSENKFSIRNNTITNISQDTKGNLWFVTKKGEVDVFPKNNEDIGYYSGSENHTPTPLLSLLKTRVGSLWMGTDGDGLTKVRLDGSKTGFGPSKTGKSFFEGRYIQDLLEDSNGNIWIGTYQNGLWIHNPKSGTFIKKKIADSRGRVSLDIRNLFKDSKNRIWVASGAAVHVFSENQEQLASYDYNSHGLSGTLSLAITEDSKNCIWMGVNPSGLYKFIENTANLQNSEFEQHQYYEPNQNNSQNYNIAALVNDHNDGLILLCASGFLIKHDPQKGTYAPLAQQSNLKDIQVRSIIVEDKDNLWISSSNGIHHFNTRNNSLKSYYQIDGLQGNSFLRNSSFKHSDGTLYFGGENGTSFFLPGDLGKNETKGQLYINNIEILNKPAKSMIPEQLTGRVESVKKLNLKASMSSFSFQFSALDNVMNPNYHYAYRLQGFDDDWIVPKKDRIATYTNIASGDYIFEVKAGSKKGEWDLDPKSISIHISPPWWGTTLAYFLYAIFLLALTYGVFLWLRLRSRLRKEAWQNRQEKEIYAMKMNFFAKMSHEIQTPLTLILGPIDDMLQRATSNKNKLLKRRLNLIKNNAQRLSRISNELMTVRNKELGTLKLRVCNNDLIKDLKTIALSFSEQAHFKQIDFKQEYPQEEISIWYDRYKIEHVFYNLLSNAFKFTPREGNILLKVQRLPRKDLIEITITDSGPGIPEAELDDVFKLFYQAEEGKKAVGSGIGLALTKELITLHHGEIEVNCPNGEGACFTVRLSSNEEIFTQEEKMTAATQFIEPTISGKEGLSKEPSITSNKKANTLLVVEDNVEMQIFLRDVLTTTFNVLIAENGQQGIALAQKHNPDLILSDIMMPVMDGIEMSKSLRKNKLTAHIPIILLTARNAEATKLKGLKSGAVEYLKKPFNFNELLMKVTNILATREKMISKYKLDRVSTPDKPSVRSRDDIFMERLAIELNTQLENSDFRLEDLTASMNMSYSVIYRKCQEIAGKTLVEFQRTLKMKKAALLIIERNYGISEAAFMVGYKDSKYFTKCFKEEFGIPPTALKAEMKKIGLSDVIKKYNIHAASVS
ncbi:response regulator [Spongiimicrobium sp. 3-5]|uniref:response regulator n=1 Tax=Spongiimicrobium sp. 3-5 TaxID=3332596 RepID=UPI00398063DE